MNKSLLMAVLTTLPLSMPLAWADEAHRSDMDKTPATTMTDQDKQVQMGKMQEHMLRMHEQMHKIMDAKNPQERERLMQEHSKMMQDGMRMKQGMMGDHGLKAITGVGDVKVSLSDGEAMVQYDERLTSPDQLQSAVRDAGYGVNTTNTTPEPQGKGGCCG